MISRTVDDTKKYAEEFASQIEPGKDTATIIGLSGDLGSGKTTFTQCVAAFFGVTEKVLSPTFVIEKIYKLPAGQQFQQLIHIDAYRIDSGKDLRILDWEYIYRNPNNIILIEWHERVQDILPVHHTKVSFKTLSDQSREIIITKA